jgi:hypothetical protein
MARFTTTVDAFRLEGAEPWPAWLVDAEQRGEFWPGLAGGGDIFQASSLRQVGRGEWLILDAAGRLTPCRHSDFERIYQPAEVDHANDA